MSLKKRVELITHTNNGLRVTDVKLLSEKRLPVGGAEGIKNIVEISLLGRRSSYRFISKVYSYESSKDKDELLFNLHILVNNYALLRKNGFLVPGTIRCYIDEKTKTVKLVMSDITMGGQYRIWGVSDKMTALQIRELQAMKFTPADQENISKMIIEMKLKANRINCILQAHFYHILKDKETGQILIGLLDINLDIRSRRPVRQNNLNVEEFREFLEKYYQLKLDNLLPDSYIVN